MSRGRGGSVHICWDSEERMSLDGSDLAPLHPSFLFIITGISIIFILLLSWPGRGKWREREREVRRGDRRSSSARASWNVFDTNRIISGPRRRMKMVMDAAGIHNYPTAMRLRFFNPMSYRRRDKNHSSHLASSRAPLPQPLNRSLIRIPNNSSR